MTRIVLNIQTNENLKLEEVKKYEEILTALVRCGGLSGVKNGQTIIHFDGDGNFRGVQLSYWPWKKKKLSTETHLTSL